MHRWFTDRDIRVIFPPGDHDEIGRALVADLRAVQARRGADPVSSAIVARLRARSAEFAALWDRHDVAVKNSLYKRVIHPAVGVIDVDLETLHTPLG